MSDPHERTGALEAEEFDLTSYLYDLPQELIAQEPAPIRDQSRLLTVNSRGQQIRHRQFADLPELLRSGDLLVLNETKVVRCLLRLRKASGGKAELLIIDPVSPFNGAGNNEPAVRTCLAKTSKGIRSGAVIYLGNGDAVHILEVTGRGCVKALFPVEEKDFLGYLEHHGSMPLPPYIKTDAAHNARDGERYQTVFSKQPGSVAAPTAGLHFTPELLARLEEKDVHTARITLHVGPGTFQPIRSQDIREHTMAAERFAISAQAAEAVNSASREGRRIIAVGSTALRSLETAADSGGVIQPVSGASDLFVYPGYRFKIVRNLITNFHLPGSTLFLLVCALVGRSLVIAAYEQAIKRRYRFYSYGDACLFET